MFKVPPPLMVSESICRSLLRVTFAPLSTVVWLVGVILPVPPALLIACVPVPNDSAPPLMFPSRVRSLAVLPVIVNVWPLMVRTRVLPRFKLLIVGLVVLSVGWLGCAAFGTFTSQNDTGTKLKSQFVAVSQSVLVTPIQVMTVLMLVLVATCVPVSGSMVLGVVLVPLTRVKFEPVTVPCVCTDAAPGGVLTVASYLIVTLLPSFNTTGRLKEIVSPENGMAGFGAIAFETDGALARPPPVSITDSEPLLTPRLAPRSVVTPPL